MADPFGVWRVVGNADLRRRSGRAKNSARGEHRFVERVIRAGFEPRRVIGAPSRLA